ncbi:MAG: TIGR03905 family TSCPD domain-containing protein [Lachnospiraceae bacterium]|nr:TIGR03905 family TSCPD domain-containing protein [Lachnospiraceae bacterium]
MFHFDYLTENTCSKVISFDLDGEIVKNIHFLSGCDGNLKTIPLLLDGWTVDQIESKLSGIQCGRRGTSCSDQLAKAVRAGLIASKDPNYKSPLEEDIDE